MSTLFWDRFKSICDETKQTPTGVVRALGLSSGNPSAWRTGRVPSMTIIVKLASHFKVEPEYFLSEEAETKKAPEQGLSDDDIQFALFGDAPITDEDFEDVRRFAAIIADRARRRKKNEESQ